MKKIYLIVTLFAAVLLLENCRKDSVSATATSTALLFADINDTVWNPTSINAVINFNAANKTKTFSVSGVQANQQINFAVTIANGSNSAGFVIGNYNVNTSGNVVMSYGVQHGNNFVPQGTVLPGSGYVNITAVDSVKKLITGTFAFTTTQKNVDGNGNIISTTINGITQGTFNKTAYTFGAN